VIEVTERSEPALRRVACTVLGRLRASAAIPVLRELARDPSPELAQAAADALRALESATSASK
jgi:HEAT repeat protein